MSIANEHVFQHGRRDTRETIELWSQRPGGAAWLAGAERGDRADAAGGGLVRLRPADPGCDAAAPARLYRTGRRRRPVPILWRNSLVLALHATAYVAGFIAGASMPIAAAQRTGFSRWVHVKAGELAILFVAAVTLFSLCTQALYLGFQGSTIAYQLRISRLELILSVLPHAIPELTALFLLPLRRLADRQPPRRVEPAAGGDLRHRRPGGADAAGRGDDRGLRLAPHPRIALFGPLLAAIGQLTTPWRGRCRERWRGARCSS